MTVLLKIAIAGATGRMGLALLWALSTYPSLKLVASRAKSTLPESESFFAKVKEF
ncbi:MAG: hypothetical protein K2X09_01110 [Rickettsiales bacterium]|nr:hypothetical protein [Rickettsiales bacterium]